MALKMGGTSFNNKRGSRRNKGFDSTINVTPLVDVMLVLLIIFMVAAPMLTVGVNVDLPKTQATALNDQEEPLIVSIDANGDFFLQETKINDIETLINKLRAIGSNTKIYVRGDQKISYGKVMEMMGILSAAGFSKVSLIAEAVLTNKK